jgi:Bacterial membrane protein YfhO
VTAGLTLPNLDGSRRPAPTVASAADRPRGRWPWLLVGLAVAWNLVNLRAETLGVSYLDDSSLHEQMVRFATQQFRAGHLPLTSWFPFLGLGSPQFLHYQSLPAMLTGLIGLAVGPDTAFRWTLYLLLSVWPLSVYLAARLFGAGRPAAAASAAMSPFLVSATGIGYEEHAYLWTGFGVWTQLWASLVLPLAWGFSWRAIRHGRNICVAVLLVALTIALHFETGYLALIPLLLWPFIAGGPLRRRAQRGLLLLAGSLLATAWVIVPLLEQREWAATNEILQGTGLVNGYGAGRVLGWLITGQLLDHGRLPVVTAFAVVGLVLACTRWREDRNARAVLVVFAACLLLSFGRTTFGGLVDVIPGHQDIFFRRFGMGVQLAALLLAGTGAAWSATASWNACQRALAGRGLRWPAPVRRNELARAALALIAAVVVLAPAWLQLGAYARHNAAAITSQRRADATQGAQLNRLIALVKADGGGRVYAGLPSNWGMNFTVGAVPVFKYLESRDVDEVGYALRTASLMTDPEYFFDDRDPSDYRLFGIHYLIVPSGYLPPPWAARLATRAGPYSLWTVNTSGYVSVGRIVGHLEANRTNLGERSIPLLHSRLAQHNDYLRITLGQSGNADQRLPTEPSAPSPGSVMAETDNVTQGEVDATVTMRRPGEVILSASYDPGWTATIDGRALPTQMIAPALVGTRVPAGTHRVVFRYHGFRSYPLLFAVSGLALLVLAGAPVLRRLQSGRATPIIRGATGNPDAGNRYGSGDRGP